MHPSTIGHSKRSARLVVSAMVLLILTAWESPLPSPAKGQSPTPAAEAWTGEALMREAGTWLLAQMRDDATEPAEGQLRGAFWPQFSAHPFTTDSLYSGTAGVIPPLLTLHEATGEEDYAEAARRAVQHFIDNAIETPEGLTWDIAWDDAEETVHYHRRSGFYTGTAGIAWALLVAGDQLAIPDATTAALRAFAWVHAQARPVAGADADARFYDGGTDIIAGNAGVALAFLEAYRYTADTRYLTWATETADALLATAQRSDDGWAWSSHIGWDRLYTGFSHGVAGIGYVFARLYALTGAARFLEGAQHAARWLERLEVRIVDEDGTRWRRGVGADGLDSAWEGWCHGPAGTCRLHLQLYSLTGDASHLRTATEAARWIMATHFPDRDRYRSGFYTTSLCCGAAGVGTFMLDLWRVTGDTTYRDYAAQIADWLGRAADHPAEGQATWSLTGRPNPTHGVMFYGTNLMTGQGGYITFLARLGQALSGTVREVVQTPDFAVVGGPVGKRLLIVEYGADASRFRRATRRLASYRGAEWLRIENTAEATPLLLAAARYRTDALALMVTPQVLDINLNRRVLHAVCRLDDDLFPDAAYGYFTGAQPDHVLAMLDSMAHVEVHGITPRAVDYGITPSFDRLMAYPEQQNAAGFRSRGVYMPSRNPETCPNPRQYIPDLLARAEGCGLVSFGGCGDPMRVWLFSDRRNMQRELHWPYDEARILRDFAHEEMPGLGATDLIEWDLAPAVVWWSTCHAGVPGRAMVAGDIVSTFGAVPNHAVAFYDLAPEESLCLQVLARGPSAYLAPIGPNHGALANVEEYRAKMQNLPLGEAIRRNHIDVTLTYREQNGIPLVQQVAGRREATPPYPGAIMREGVLNRILFGDPTFAPFATTSPERPSLAVAVSPVVAEELHAHTMVEVTVVDPRSPENWDPYRGNRERDERVVGCFELPDNAGDDVSFIELEAGGEAVTFGEWAIERRRGRRPLVWFSLNAPRPADFTQRTLWLPGHTFRLHVHGLLSDALPAVPGGELRLE